MIKKENNRKKTVDFEFEEFKTLPPEELVKLASIEKPLPIYRTAREYVKVMKCLRNKHYTWNEVTIWFARHGLPYTMPTIRSAYRNEYEKDVPLYEKKNGEIKV